MITSDHAKISMKEGVAPTLAETKLLRGTSRIGIVCGSTLARLVPTVTVGRNFDEMVLGGVSLLKDTIVDG